MSAPTGSVGSAGSAVTAVVVKPNAVALFNKFFNNENGRDKFNKVLQYGARYMMVYLQQHDPKNPWIPRFKAMFMLTRDCRMIIRLFKFVGEYEKIEGLLKQPYDANVMLQLIGTAGLAVYWFFDNLNFFARGQMIASNDRYARWSMIGWCAGITTSMIIEAQTLAKNFAEEQRLRAKHGLPDGGAMSVLALDCCVDPASSASSTSSTTTADMQAARAALQKLLTQRINLYLSFVKNTGDWLVSANGFDLFPMIGAKPLDDATTSLAGLAAGLAVCLSVYRGL